MPDPGKIARAVHLLKVSLGVVEKNRKLLFFPLANFVFFMLTFVMFFGPTIVRPTGHSWGQTQHWEALGVRFATVLSPWSSTGYSGVHWTGYAFLAALYLCFGFGITFLNVAFYHEAIKALAGEPVSLRRGLAFGRRRLRAILAWTLFTGSVGLIIKFVSEKVGVVGQFALRFVGFTWSIAATFVVPVMIRNESSNPISLLRSSATTIRKTWGELLLGYSGIYVLYVVTGLIMAVLFPGVILIVHLFSAHVARDIVLSMIGLGIVFVPISVVLSMADNIFRCALYVYASEGVVPEPYSAELLDTAWKVKKA